MKVFEQEKLELFLCTTVVDLRNDSVPVSFGFRVGHKRKGQIQGLMG